MTTDNPDGEQFITAEDALIDLEMASLGMREGGPIGRLEGDEARKLVVELFAGEELPSEVKQFFDFGEEQP
jgi:hypothetical protein